MFRHKLIVEGCVVVWGTIPPQLGLNGEMVLNDGELTVRGSASMSGDNLTGGSQPPSRALVDTTGSSPVLKMQMNDQERTALAPFLVGQFSRGEFEVTFVSEGKLGVNEPVSGAGRVLPERPRLTFRRKLVGS